MNDRWNCWFGRTYTVGRHWSFHLWPSMELTWIGGNRSFHIHVQWLLWEFRLNTFRRREQRSSPDEEV